MHMNNVMQTYDLFTCFSFRKVQIEGISVQNNQFYNFLKTFKKMFIVVEAFN